MPPENERRPRHARAAGSWAGGPDGHVKDTRDLRHVVRCADLRLLVWAVDPTVSLVMHDEVVTLCLRCRARQAWTVGSEIRCHRCGHRESRWGVEGRVLRDLRACERLTRAVAEAA